jgi:hypothetical protein
MATNEVLVTARVGCSEVRNPAVEDSIEGRVNHQKIILILVVPETRTYIPGLAMQPPVLPLYVLLCRYLVQKIHTYIEQDHVLEDYCHK